MLPHKFNHHQHLTRNHLSSVSSLCSLYRGARTSGLHWEASLSCSGSGYHEASAVRHDSPKLVGAPGYWPANPDASKVGVSGGQARTLRSLWGGLVSMFSRRSRRKQFDKTLSIQQHLRAIRHAENLDRKTHFRRSQGKSHVAVSVR